MPVRESMVEMPQAVDRRVCDAPWPIAAGDELEREVQEILHGFSHARRLTHRSEPFDLGIAIGRLQAQLRAYVRRIGAIVAQQLVARTLRRESARRAFDACHRLDVTWLQLCEVRDELVATAHLDGGARHLLDLRLARLADRYGSDARLAHAIMSAGDLAA
jgi:hypothetical protein